MSNLMIAHSQWASRPKDERFESLSALYDSVSKRRNISRVETVDMENLLVRNDPSDDSQFKFVVRGKNRLGELDATHWSFGQVCRQVGAPAGYLRTLPTNIARDAVTHGIQKHKGEEVKLMTLYGEGSPILQASTSKTYGRIWDADVVAAVQRIVAGTNNRFFNPKEWNGKPGGLYGSDHDVFMFMIDGGSWVDGGSERDQLHRGFIVRNSEVGACVMDMMTFLFRGCCGNHIIWGAEQVNRVAIRHTSGGPDRFDREVQPTLESYVNSSTKTIEEQIKKAKLIMLPKENSEIIEYGMDRGLTRSEMKIGIEFAKAEEGDCSNLWELVQGLTASARGLDWMDARMDLEKRSSNLLTKAGLTEE